MVRNRAVALMVVGATLALAACQPTPTTKGQVLAESWATATDVMLMDIPADCPAQRLEYAAWQKDTGQPASVEFVVSQQDTEVQATGTGDFADYADGAADWTLKDDAVYALTVRGVNARWRFAVTCQ